jgi:hypothetical protein
VRPTHELAAAGAERSGEAVRSILVAGVAVQSPRTAKVQPGQAMAGVLPGALSNAAERQVEMMSQQPQKVALRRICCRILQ